jgi:uncharacterized membrane protein YhaH (DUF805 family)
MDWKSYLLSPKGRLARGKYWLAFLIYLGIGIIGVLIAVSLLGGRPDSDPAMIYAGIFGAIVYVAIAVSSIMIAIKRLHDRDKSGWWLLLFYGLPGILSSFAPKDNSAASLILNLVSLAFSVWALVELGFLRGTDGPNRFGPDPLQAFPQP